MKQAGDDLRRGGYNGFIPKLTDNVPGGPAADKLVPLGCSYAVLASGSGHEGADADSAGDFALIAEVPMNDSHDALKKTCDTALYLIGKRYGTGPAHSYFTEGLRGASRRWP